MPAPDAGFLVSLIKHLELQLSVADVEELVKLMKQIIRTMPKNPGGNTKAGNSFRKSIMLDERNLGNLGNAFAIVFVEVFEGGALNAGDWEMIETALECIVAAKHVRDFELMDWFQEEEARKAREAEDPKKKEYAEKADQDKVKQQHILRLQEIRELKKQCEYDEDQLLAWCRKSSSSTYVDGAPKPVDLYHDEQPQMKKPKVEHSSQIHHRYVVSPGKEKIGGRWYTHEQLREHEKQRKQLEERQKKEKQQEATIAANRAAALARKQAKAAQRR